MASSSSRGPYAKTAVVRTRILEACAAVLAETGYHGLLMKDVAERAGISPRGLVHHFSNKDELLAAVLQSIEGARAGAGPASGHPAGVAAVVDTALGNRLKPGVVDLVTTLSAAATSPEHPAHEYFEQRIRTLRAYLALAFDALREEGRLASDVDSLTLSNMLIALFDGMNLQSLYHPDEADVEKAIATFLDVIGADLVAFEPASDPDREITV